MVGRERHFRVTLKAGCADVGLVVARTVNAVAHQVLQFAGRLIELTAQAIKVALQLHTDFFLLGNGPWFFVGTHGQLDL